MLKFILRRLSYGFFVLFGVALVVFFLFHILPGDPARIALGQRADAETLKNKRKAYGLDQPLPVQLIDYLNDLSPIGVHPDTEEARKQYEYAKLFPVSDESVLAIKLPYLRRSFESDKKVSEIIGLTFEGTFWLAFAAMVFASIFGILFGLIAALNQGTFWDHLLVGGSSLGISAPSFVTATLMSLVFGFYLSEYTGLSITGYLWELEGTGRRLVLKNLILPAITLGIRPLAIITQLTRSSMLEVLGQDYIRTAKSKGLGKMIIIFKHALKNALNPVVTAVTGWLASLLAGAFFVEIIFNWRGLANRTIRAVWVLDFPVIMGTTLVVATAFIVISMLVDILYAILDPRVRLR